MKNKADKVLGKLIAIRQENLRMLILRSFKELEEMSHFYYQSFKITGSNVTYEKFRQVDEAIQIKKGNEEQAWDFLT